MLGLESGLGWEQHFKGIERELIALHLCARQFVFSSFFFLFLTGAVLALSDRERRGSVVPSSNDVVAVERRLSGHLQERTPFRHAVLS